MSSVAHDDQMAHNELLYLMQEYLSRGPCRRTAQALREEIEQHQLLPQRYDYAGVAHARRLSEYEWALPRGGLRDADLMTCIRRLRQLIDVEIPPSLPNLPFRLIASRRLALTRTRGERGKRGGERGDEGNGRGAPMPPEEMSNHPISESVTIRSQTLESTISSLTVPRTRDVHDLRRALAARECGVRIAPHRVLGRQGMANLERHARILGHLAAVFCVKFDRAGQFIFTGADDNLVKVWNASTVLLRFTFRGHSAEITDITVSHDNTVLASGSVDKTVRVWCLQTGATLAVYRAHTAMVTLIAFLPYMSGDDRYLLSAGSDCVINFYKWNAGSRSFDQTPTRFHERVTASARILSSCHSPGGNLVVSGDTHNYIHIYRITSDVGVVKLGDIQAHTDRVDSLVWAHNGLRFASGSRDGLAKVWTVKCGDWVAQTLDTHLRSQVDEKDKNKYRVTMLCWSLNDSILVTAGSDHLLRTWNWRTGTQLKILRGHSDEAFVLDAHPLWPDQVLSAGHDGLLIAWDLVDGAIISQDFNAIEGRGWGSLFDLAISPDGTLVATVDSLGHLSILGIGKNNAAKTMPNEQFFHTDYRPMIADANGYVLDSQSQLAAHLMPPPQFVNGDGHPYPAIVQRLVPGNNDRGGAVASGGQQHGENAADATSSTHARVSCAWLTRVIVRPLDRFVAERMTEQLKVLGDEEANEWMAEYEKKCERERKREEERGEIATEPLTSRQSRGSNRRGIGGRVTRGVVADVDAAIYGYGENEAILDGVSGSGVSTRRRRRVPRADNHNANNGLDDVIVDSDSSLTSSSEGDDDDDSSDTDYLDNSPQPSSSRRLRRSRESRDNNGEEDEGGEDEGDEEEEEEEGRDEEEGDARPGESSTNHTRRGTRATRRSQSASSRADSRWTLQVGDEVVYFRQGHDHYLNIVTERQDFRVTAKMRPRDELDAEVFAVIEDVRYLRMDAVRVTCAHLRQIDRATGEPTELQFYVAFHDLDNVPDFIILRHHYEESMRSRWQPGERIEAILDEKWWTGTVARRAPYDEAFPDSNWYSLVITWDNGDEEPMSPWDVQPCTPGRRTGHPTTLEDSLQMASYRPLPDDWSAALGGRDAICDRALDAIRALVDGVELVQPFRYPVSLDAYPDYAQSVDYPIDLETIGKRLANRFYRRMRSLCQDIRFLATNAAIFNLPDSPIVHNARVLVEALVKYINDDELTDIVQLFDHCLCLSEGELVEWRSPQRTTRRKSRTMSAMLDDADVALNDDNNCPPSTSGIATGTTSAETGTSRSERARKGESAGRAPAWRNECEHVLHVLMANPSATHFLNRDNPELSTVFDSALDLGAIADHLANGTYENPQAFHDVVDNLLQNCRLVADNKRSPLYRDSLFLSAFFKEKMAPVLAKWMRMHPSTITTSSGQSNTSSPGGEGRSGVYHHHQLRHRPAHHFYNTRRSSSAFKRAPGGSRPTDDARYSGRLERSIDSSSSRRSPSRMAPQPHASSSSMLASASGRPRPQLRPRLTYQNGEVQATANGVGGSERSTERRTRATARVMSSDEEEAHASTAPASSVTAAAPVTRASANGLRKRRRMAPSNDYDDIEAVTSDDGNRVDRRMRREQNGRRHHHPRRLSPEIASRRRSTRNAVINYNENSEDEMDNGEEEEVLPSVSSRGRVRRLRIRHLDGHY